MSGYKAIKVRRWTNAQKHDYNLVIECVIWVSRYACVSPRTNGLLDAALRTGIGALGVILTRGLVGGSCAQGRGNHAGGQRALDTVVSRAGAVDGFADVHEQG